MEFLGTKGRWYLQKYTDAYTNIIRCDNGEGLETIYIASTGQSTNPRVRHDAQIMAHAPQLLEMLIQSNSRLSKLRRSMIAHPDHTEASEFDDMTSLSQELEDKIETLIKQATTI